MLNLTSAQEIHDMINSPAGPQMPVIEFPVELTPGQPAYLLSCVVAGSAEYGYGRYIWNVIRRRVADGKTAEGPQDVFRAAVTADAEYHLISQDWK